MPRSTVWTNFTPLRHTEWPMADLRSTSDGSKPTASYRARAVVHSAVQSHRQTEPWYTMAQFPGTVCRDGARVHPIMNVTPVEFPTLGTDKDGWYERCSRARRTME